jgi:hypothetical protein
MLCQNNFPRRNRRNEICIDNFQVPESSRRCGSQAPKYARSDSTSLLPPKVRKRQAWIWLSTYDGISRIRSTFCDGVSHKMHKLKYQDFKSFSSTTGNQTQTGARVQTFISLQTSTFETTQPILHPPKNPSRCPPRRYRSYLPSRLPRHRHHH